MSMNASDATTARKRVLLVEDNLVNQRVAMAFVKKLGYEVSLAINGEEAVEKFRGAVADLILMDCNMPEVDGMEATRRIRRIEQDQGLLRTPIIALTAHAFSDIVEKCHEAGMDDHLAKPIIYEKLRDVMAHWCK